jgi:hypothetical protein
MAARRPPNPTSPIEENLIHAFHGPILELGTANLYSMIAVEKVVLACFQHMSSPRPLQCEKDALATARLRLMDALVTARDGLRNICDAIDMQQRASDGEIGFPQQVFDFCLFTISLSQVSCPWHPSPSHVLITPQMAQEMLHALHVGENIATTYESSALRLWHPRFSWAWLGLSPSTIVLEERGTFLDDETPETATMLSPEETLQGLAEHNYAPGHGSGTALKTSKLTGTPFSFRWCYSLASYVWNHAQMFRFRLSLSRWIRLTQHSSHLKHAIKNAAGVALLSVPAFLPVASSGQYSYFAFPKSPNGFSCRP